MIFSPKGGVGKSTIASNLLVASASSGLRTVGLDFDGQHSLGGWFESRRQHPHFEHLVGLDFGALDLSDWHEGFSQTEGHDVVILDMPPGVDPNSAATMAAMMSRIDLVVMPALMERPSYIKVIPFMEAFRQKGTRAMFVMNKVKKNQIALREAREELGSHGRISPSEITERNEVFRAFDVGLAISEMSDAAGYGEMRSLWNDVYEQSAAATQQVAA